jgi:hypothetical protein
MSAITLNALPLAEIALAIVALALGAYFTARILSPDEKATATPEPERVDIWGGFEQARQNNRPKFPENDWFPRSRAG